MPISMPFKWFPYFIVEVFQPRIYSHSDLCHIKAWIVIQASIAFNIKLSQFSNNRITLSKLSEIASDIISFSCNNIFLGDMLNLGVLPLCGCSRHCPSFPTNYLSLVLNGKSMLLSTMKVTTNNINTFFKTETTLLFYKYIYIYIYLT